MLRDGFPDAKIGWAIDTGLAPAIAGHPALDYVHRCSRREWSRALSHPASWSPTYHDFQAFIGEIRSVGYDVAVDVQGLFKTAVVPYLAGIKRRIGYRHGREFSSMFYTERYLDRDQYFDPTVSHLQHMAELARSIGAGDVRQTIEPPRLTDATRGHVAELLNGAFSTAAPIVAIAPATQWVSKMWPLEHWTALLRQILAETDLNLVVQGSAADARIGAQILREFPAARRQGRICDLFGKLPIAEMYALYERVQVAVGSDSAPLHVAGAMRVPVLIGIYGPTGYRRTPPIGSPHIKLFSTEGELACQPCHKRVCPLGTTECMKRITPGEVFQALLEGLRQAAIPFACKPPDTVPSGRLVSLQ
jgi:lipopolysaccharide heptosyltransferase II